MGYEIGYDSNWERDVGYGVPAVCDHPDCEEKITRGLANVCGGDIYGGELGCGLFFCMGHLPTWKEEGRLTRFVCERCDLDADPFTPKPDVKKWLEHKMDDPSWAEWRAENPDEVAEIMETLKR